MSATRARVSAPGVVLTGSVASTVEVGAVGDPLHPAANSRAVLAHRSLLAKVG